MGISLAQYRYTIGNNNFQKLSFAIKNADREKCICAHFKFKLYILFYTVIIFYIFIYAQLLSICSTETAHVTLKQDCRELCYNPLHLFNMKTWSFLGYINMAYITVISKIITYNIKCGTVKRFIYNSLSSFRQFVETSLLLYITSINIILIIISNCSLLNPGPTDNSNTGDDNTIKVFYQNVHSLITFGSLGDKDPVLNIAKILELQSYVHYHQPDIVVLNETWLKSCINDSEIFHNNGYKVFRRDRNPDSHPPDPSNSNKFKSNGGGILIAVSNSLHMSPKVMKSDSKAEILPITLQL